MTVQNIQKGEVLPRHLAIIMDGNGRWAQKRGEIRVKGHKEGANAVYRIVKHSALIGINTLTLFAFSSENWKRPITEVNALMELFAFSLKKEAKELHQNNIKVRIIGDKSKFSKSLQKAITYIEELTVNNTVMTLNIAANYGGRADITKSFIDIAKEIESGNLTSLDIDEGLIQKYLYEPLDVDLLIRTGGEKRISNFLLWQIAYAEIFVTDTLWPDFDIKDMDEALDFFSKRERRFGMTSSQIKEQQ